jgi:hypothetical protein
MSGHEPTRPAPIKIRLVERQQLGHVSGLYLSEHGPDSVDLRVWIDGGGIDDVHEEVGGPDNFQGGVERIHELVGQLPDEADCVRAKDGLTSWQLEAPCPGIERGKETVLDEDLGIGEEIEQRGLASICVADERYGPKCPTLAPAALSTACCLQIPELDLELANSSHDPPSVHLELGLAWASGADPTCLLRQR